MEIESLRKIRDFITRIEEVDIPQEDKVEFLINASLIFDEKNYFKHIQTLQREHNEELRWRKKKQ